ncbi:hypothetical protein ESOMN_v1c06700 [Williamsoniiplasma somnilux]|uniref:Uncharacterized protein n=1 Tax=Williamsoniiplasma somnilux TaxID=215578 RepID=A0A2K8NZ06_9MOLU|nr:hypothetical protein ESOMN_v1c06700 [Williamsoniiplasma somnilux]
MLKINNLHYSITGPEYSFLTRKKVVFDIL